MASSLENEHKGNVQFDSENDEDEELAALRQAALMSLKPIRKRNKSPVANNISRNSSKSMYKRPLSYRESLHSNSFSSSRANIGFNKPKWRQASNLIVINTVPIEEKRPISKNHVPNLMLPQDKWCPVNKPNNSKSDSKSPKGPKKFSRIRSNSDSESDYEESDSDSSSENGGKNDSYAESKDSLNTRGSLLLEDEIDPNDSRELTLSLLDNELANAEIPLDRNVVAREEIGTDTESICQRNEDDSRDSLNNVNITSNSSVSAASDGSSDIGNTETLNRDDDSDLGSCASIELEHPEYDEIDLERTNSSRNGLESTEVKKTKMKISFEAEENENRTELPTTDDSSAPKISKKSRGERSKKTEKPLTDLRLLLKAKRGAKDSPEKEKSSERRNPVVKSVLSVVTKRSDELRERKKRDGTVSVNAGSGLKVRLLKDNTQVTVLTDKKEREEKKSSVHKRLGPYAKPSRNSAERESRNISRTVVNKINKNSESSSESSSSNGRHRSSSSSRIKSSYKRARVSGHHSGLSNVKEIQLDAKIRKIQAYNAAILKRQEEIEADKKRYAN